MSKSSGLAVGAGLLVAGLVGYGIYYRVKRVKNAAIKVVTLLEGRVTTDAELLKLNQLWVANQIYLTKLRTGTKNLVNPYDSAAKLWAEPLIVRLKAKYHAVGKAGMFPAEYDLYSVLEG